MSISIQTANIAGGDLKTHRSIEAAVNRIVRDEHKVYGGIAIVSCEGCDADDVAERARKALEDAAEYGE